MDSLNGGNSSAMNEVNEADQNGVNTQPCSDVIVRETVDNTTTDSFELIENPDTNQQAQNLPFERETLDNNKHEKIDITEQNNVIPSSSNTSSTVGAGTIGSIGLTGRALDDEVKNFLETFLSTDERNLDSREIRDFTAKTPTNYRPLPSHFSLIFEVLIKLKTVEDRAVYNDTLSFIHKIFENVEQNNFLLQFWNKLKERQIDPIGYSFSDGRSTFNYADFNMDYDFPKVLTVKNGELAWSLLMDIDETIKAMLDKCIYNQSLFVFHFCLLRRLPCLGDFMIVMDGKEIPIFIYYIRNLLADPTIQNNLRLYDSSLSLMVSVAWTPRSPHASCLISPNLVLNEIMENLGKQNQFFPSWIKALKDLFHPLDKFTSIFKWNDETTGFDNPGTFLLGFLKHFNRHNSFEINKQLLDVLKCFKALMSYCRVPVVIRSFEDIQNLDWLYSYYTVQTMSIRNCELFIPESLYNCLPPFFSERYRALPNTAATIDEALTNIFELFFILGSEIPYEFYKDVWIVYPSPPHIFDTVAKAILIAFKNLKNAQSIVFDRTFKTMVFKLCSGIDKSVFDSIQSFMEFDCEFVFGCQHLFVISRVLRRMVEDEIGGRRRIGFKDVGYHVEDVFQILQEAVTEKFNEVRDKYFDAWPQWRRDHDRLMSDEMSMAITYTLDIFQKDAFCLYEMTDRDENGLIDYLFFLRKKRKIMGINYSKVDEHINKVFPLPNDRQENEVRNSDGRGYDHYGGSDDYNYSNRSNNYRQNYGPSDRSDATYQPPRDRNDDRFSYAPYRNGSSANRSFGNGNNQYSR